MSVAHMMSLHITRTYQRPHCCLPPFGRGGRHKPHELLLLQAKRVTRPSGGGFFEAKKFSGTTLIFLITALDVAQLQSSSRWWLKRRGKSTDARLLTRLRDTKQKGKIFFTAGHDVSKLSRKPWGSSGMMCRLFFSILSGAFNSFYKVDHVLETPTSTHLASLHRAKNASV
jgi:hypothetical protein